MLDSHSSPNICSFGVCVCVCVCVSFPRFQLFESVHHEEQTAVRDHIGLVHECGRASRETPTGRTEPETIRTRRRRILKQKQQQEHKSNDRHPKIDCNIPVSFFSKPSCHHSILLVSLCFPFFGALAERRLEWSSDGVSLCRSPLTPRSPCSGV